MTMLRKLSTLAVLSVLLAFALWALQHRDSGIVEIVRTLTGQMDTDSARFLDQAWDTVHAGEALYPSLFFEQHVKFIYPTSSLLTYSAAHVLHIPTHALLTFLILVSLPVTLWFAGDIFLLALPSASQLSTSERIAARLLIASLGLFFFPLVNAVSLGQIQALLTALWTISVWLWMRNRKEAAGFSVALICIFKPQLALFLLWALLRKQWRFAASLFAATAIIQIVAIAMFGWRNEIGYLPVLSYISHHGEAFIPNQSVNGFLERLTRNASPTLWSDFIYPPYNAVVYLGTMASTAALLAFGLFGRTLFKWRNLTGDYILFGILSTLASPIAWRHHYGYLFAGFVYLFALSMGSLTQKLPILLFLSYLIIANSWTHFDHLGYRFSGLLVSYNLYAGIGLVILIALRLRHDNEYRHSIESNA